MRILAQRVTEASVSVDGRQVAAIGPGIMALVGFGQEDGPDFHSRPAFRGMAQKLTGLRIFPGQGELANKFHTSLEEFGGQLLLVPQFTLYADCRKGRRPSWSAAAPGPVAEPLVDAFAAHLRSLGATVPTGRFGADMAVQLVNDGPVTLWLDSDELA